MKQNSEHLQDLSEIRKMMENSSRFLSLSGLSGIFPGIFALVGAGIAYWKIQHSNSVFTINLNNPLLRFFILDAAVILGLSIMVALYFTWQRSQTQKQKMWNSAAKRLIINLAIPLVAGGLFCLALLVHAPVLVPSATLIFYGLALINASKYTLNEVRYLGFCQIAIGLVSSIFSGWGLGIIFWALGFGVLHIVYGTLMYKRYEA
jgi:uncharacterized membrane protein YidH (DUF202 family)